MGMRQAGVSIRGISNDTHVAKSTVWGIINQYNQRGHCKNNNKPGWKLILDDNNHANIDAYLVDNQQATLAELVDTIPKLHLWNPHQWGCIIWTYECSFELGKKSNQVPVWRTPNKKYDLANLQVNH
ncbi:hypothetical protein O181_126819 [Austropuccinia psidii MF-1]|uniref:Uncharacterized protein n=1 Tax=Austropuccinia psidii MF-1 TaxID=1389203 RepID=A0A9Q3Q6J9_9BASI|nr:hypothetical protein [Austropuccinia psidii MF-1]